LLAIDPRKSFKSPQRAQGTDSVSPAPPQDDSVSVTKVEAKIFVVYRTLHSLHVSTQFELLHARIENVLSLIGNLLEEFSSAFFVRQFSAAHLLPNVIFDKLERSLHLLYVSK
jgi:hypothetical protein